MRPANSPERAVEPGTISTPAKPVCGKSNLEFR
jgi:hypothetical protein